MRAAVHACLTTGLAITGAGLIAIGPVQPPAPDTQTRGALLTRVDAALGDGTALIMGASFFATPSQGG